MAGCSLRNCSTTINHAAISAATFIETASTVTTALVDVDRITTLTPTATALHKNNHHTCIDEAAFACQSRSTRPATMMATTLLVNVSHCVCTNNNQAFAKNNKVV